MTCKCLSKVMKSKVISEWLMTYLCEYLVSVEANIAKSCHVKSIGHIYLKNNLRLTDWLTVYPYLSLETAFLRASGVGWAYRLVKQYTIFLPGVDNLVEI